MIDEEFLNRDEELQYLDELWDSKGLVTCCIYGRKGIGKSSLLKEFSKGKRTIYLQAIQGSYYENLSALTSDVSSFCGHDIGEMRDLSHLMKVVEGLCSKEHTLVIIDDLPYLIDSAPQVASVIQKSMDRGFDDVDCMFVVCGSSISTMRKEIGNYDRPLYGRFTNVLHVKQIGLSESMSFHPKMDAYTALRWYLTVGGIPRYLQTSQSGYESNVARMFLKSPFPHRDDASQAILREFRGNHNYTGAVKCIADGHVRQSDIADRLIMDRAACKRILDDLESVNIIERIHPMMNAPKRPIYRIVDPFIAFHYGIISKNSLIIDTSDSSRTAYRLLRNKIDSHLGHMFEIVCARWLCDHLTIIEIGSWWGKDSKGVDVDIDIIAKAFDENDVIYTLVCECKFSENPMGFTTMNTLEQRCEDASIKENVRYVLFSAGGFQDDLREYADENGISLVDCETMMGLKDIPKIV